MSATASTSAQCVLILGGSFDPVHTGHVEIAAHMTNLLNPTQLRIIPSGWSWQKKPFATPVEHRLAMLQLAFRTLAQQTTLVIDRQEIERAEHGMPSYSVDTLTQLRKELGSSAALVYVIGTDQLLQLDSWKNWEALFDLAHIAAVTRPGFEPDRLNQAVAEQFRRRAADIEQLRSSAAGHTYLCSDLAIDVSSTEVRSKNKLALVPPDVLDYIQRHQLY